MVAVHFLVLEKFLGFSSRGSGVNRLLVDQVNSENHTRICFDKGNQFGVDSSLLWILRRVDEGACRGARARVWLHFTGEDESSICLLLKGIGMGSCRWWEVS